MSHETAMALLAFNIPFWSIVGIMLLWDFRESRQHRKQLTTYLYSFWLPSDCKSGHCHCCAHDIDRENAVHAVVYGESVNLCSVECYKKLVEVWKPEGYSVKRFKRAVKRTIRMTLNSGKVLLADMRLTLQPVYSAVLI